jgi:hypothetical protein
LGVGGELLLQETALSLQLATREFHGVACLLILHPLGRRGSQLEQRASLSHTLAEAHQYPRDQTRMRERDRLHGVGVGLDPSVEGEVVADRAFDHLGMLDRNRGGVRPHSRHLDTEDQGDSQQWPEASLPKRTMGKARRTHLLVCLHRREADFAAPSHHD